MLKFIRIFIYFLFCLSAVYAQPPATPTMLYRTDKPGVDTMCRIPTTGSPLGDMATYVVSPVAGARSYVYNDTIMNWDNQAVIVGRVPSTSPSWRTTGQPWAVVRNRSFTAPFGDTVEVLTGNAAARTMTAATSTMHTLAAVPALQPVPWNRSYIYMPKLSDLGNFNGNIQYRVGATSFPFTAAGQVTLLGTTNCAIRNLDIATPFGDTVEILFGQAYSGEFTAQPACNGYGARAAVPAGALTTAPFFDFFFDVVWIVIGVFWII
jgi:hypothetical protein